MDDCVMCIWRRTCRRRKEYIDGIDKINKLLTENNCDFSLFNVEISCNYYNYDPVYMYKEDG